MKVRTRRAIRIFITVFSSSLDLFPVYHVPWCYVPSIPNQISVLFQQQLLHHLKTCLALLPSCYLQSTTVCPSIGSILSQIVHFFQIPLQPSLSTAVCLSNWSKIRHFLLGNYCRNLFICSDFTPTILDYRRTTGTIQDCWWPTSTILSCVPAGMLVSTLILYSICCLSLHF